MSKIEILNSKLAFLSFDSEKLPVAKLDYRGFVKLGDKNDYFLELLRYYESHAEHGAIIGAKARFGRGKKLNAVNEAQQQALDSFWDSINRYETYGEFAEKFWLDAEIFNGVYIQILTDLSGRITDYFHLSRANCRLSEDGNTLYYSEDWSRYDFERKEYPIYTKGNVGLSFVEFKFYQPAGSKLKSLYPLPQYNQCTTEIKSDIDIGTFDHNYVLNGFTAGHVITFFNGEPDPPKKKEIREKFEGSYTGPGQAGNVIINYAGKDGKAVEVSAIATDGLGEKFETIQKRYQQKILTGHNVVNPELFGIKTEGQLGNRVSLKESHELFINSYTKPRQEIANKFFEKLIFLKTGQWIEMENVQIDAIGYDLSTDQDLTQDERRELKGYKPLTAVAVNPDGTPTAAPIVNESLTGLTAAQNADMLRVVRDFKKGRSGMTEHMAIDRLKAYGITEETAKKYLGIDELPVQMSAVDFILTQFESIDTTDENEYELLEESEHIHNSKQAFKYELSAMVKFADKPSLIDTLIGRIGNIFNPKSKEKKSDSEEEVTEIVTKYHYALKEGALPAKSGSRPFCVNMLALKDKSGKQKEFTFEQIDSVRLAGLKNGMPEVDNIWDYRGGFYTKPGTNETDPFCRHIWKARTYKVKRKA